MAAGTLPSPPPSPSTCDLVRGRGGTRLPGHVALTNSEGPKQHSALAWVSYGAGNLRGPQPPGASLRSSPGGPLCCWAQSDMMSRTQGPGTTWKNEAIVKDSKRQSLLSCPRHERQAGQPGRVGRAWERCGCRAGSPGGTRRVKGVLGVVSAPKYMAQPCHLTCSTERGRGRGGGMICKSVSDLVENVTGSGLPSGPGPPLLCGLL